MMLRTTFIALSLLSSMALAQAADTPITRSKLFDSLPESKQASAKENIGKAIRAESLPCMEVTDVTVHNRLMVAHCTVQGNAKTTQYLVNPKTSDEKFTKLP